MGLYMLLRSTTLFSAVLLTASLSACASNPLNKSASSTQSYYPQAQSHAVQKAEAAMVCDNENMRSRANDRNSKNDTARVLILEEGGNNSNIIADVQVNCRDYFKSVDYQGSPQPQYVPQASYTPATYEAPQPETQIIRRPAPESQPRNIQASAQTELSAARSGGFLYTVRKGDTLYNIARVNCTSVKHLTALNNLDDATLIDIDQVLHLPATRCNSDN